MQRPVDWFRVLVILSAAALMLWLVFAIPRAFAAEAQLTWVQPTQNVDGSSIPASGEGRLIGNRAEWGTCNGTAFGIKAGEQAFATPTTAYTVTGLTPGTWCFRVYASSTYGESGPSNVAQKVITPPLPKPPTGLTVADGTAFTVLKREDRFVLLPVGTVPAGTACDTTQSVNGMYVVPRDAVTWSGTVKPVVVVSACS